VLFAPWRQRIRESMRATAQPYHHIVLRYNVQLTAGSIDSPIPTIRLPAEIALCCGRRDFTGFDSRTFTENPTIMKTTSRFGLSRQIARLLLLLSCSAASGGRATDSAAVPPDVSAPQAIVSEARLSLAEARKTQSDPKIAVGHYLDAADAAARSVGRSPDTEITEEARSIYNAACQEVAVLLRASAELWNRTETIPSRQGTYQLRFAPASRKEGTWDPAYCDFFRTPKQVHEKIAHQEARINDWGGVLVGVYKPSDPRKQFLPLVGLAVPVTAVLDFAPPTPAGGQAREATLALYDPTRRETLHLAGSTRSLGADFGAPLAYYPEPGLLLAFMATIRPANYENRAGIYMLEPYDPDRIPVILIHGLVSIPQMWVPTISAIESDPKLHGRYQFWVFAYPTGDPILLTALELRQSLARVYQLYPKTKNMVLISHSMGGLLSQMQAVTTKRVLWDRVFQGDSDRLYAKVPPDHAIKRALIFDANPRIQRIVFICVPHRGSDLAINWIGSFAIGLVSLPGKILSGAVNVVTLEKDVGIKHMPTGINGLSPRSPVLLGLDTLPIHAPYHSIIGDRGRGDTPNSSDGVVAYWSSHLTGARSELIVPGPHGSFALPQTVSELKRILLLNLAAGGAPHRNVILKRHGSAAGLGRKRPEVLMAEQRR
jgi:pimeloyl-ACP methyl ester carboxylesterase